MPPSATGRRDGYVPPCISTQAYKVLAGLDWVHEIKRDGYRLQVWHGAIAPSLYSPNASGLRARTSLICTMSRSI